MMNLKRNSIFITSLLALLLFLNSFTFSQGKPVNGLADVGGSKLYYETAGKGPAVVLIHGGLVDSRLWNHQFEKFARHFKVIRYDLRGFGRSDFSYGPFSHVADLHSLLKYLKIEKASLVGLSLGGIIAADFALEHPEMVEKLVLTSSGLRAGARSLRNAQAAAIYKVSEEQGRDKAIQMWLDHPFFASGRKNTAYVKLTRQMLIDNFRYWGPTPEIIQLTWSIPPTIERLKDIKVPTLIVTGDKDAPEILTVAEMLKAGIAGSTTRIIKNTSHHLVIEKPGKYNRIVLDFLQKT
jgi:pimeloyl-ACP methyl ester carboxylesterase